MASIIAWHGRYRIRPQPERQYRLAAAFDEEVIEDRGHELIQDRDGAISEQLSPVRRFDSALCPLRHPDPRRLERVRDER
jgi:hypothetical protein